MRISVVTAVFNRVATIGHTAQSLRAQSYHNYEHIIQDGGSTDGTLEVLQAFTDPRARLISRRDRGIYDALNMGLERATGEVVGVLHSDDFYAHEDVLKRVAAAFETYNADAVYGDLDYVSAGDTAHIVRHWRAGAFSLAKLRRGWMPPHPTLFLRREIFDKLGKFDTSFRISADYDAILRYFGRDSLKTVYLPEVLVKMRTGGESNRSLERVILKSREDYRALRKNKIGGIASLAWKNVSKLHQFMPRPEN